MTRAENKFASTHGIERLVGSVEAVSANRVIVRLTTDAPGSTSIVDGWPASFPRINGYLLIPTEAGATIGMITEVTIESASIPSAIKLSGIVNLPQSSRLITLVPIGTLVERGGSGSRIRSLKVRRGVDVFPSVGDSVLLPTKQQMQVMVEGESDGDSAPSSGRILLGTCPTAAGSSVYFDPDKIFGRHLAVLGNTGSGKSCSVAGIIRWSLEEASKSLLSGRTSGTDACPNGPNARFIILDPNGEYRRAFKDLEVQGKVRCFGVSTVKQQALQVPAWLWNAEEWSAFTSAAPGVQRPLLYEALRRLKAPQSSAPARRTAKYATSVIDEYRDTVGNMIAQQDYLKPGMEGANHFGILLNRLHTDLTSLKNAGLTLSDSEEAILQKSIEIERKHREKLRSSTTTTVAPTYYYSAFGASDVLALKDAFGRMPIEADRTPVRKLNREDAPFRFDITQLAPLIKELGRNVDGRDVGNFVDTLRLRIETMIGSEILSSVVGAGPNSPSLSNWLEEYIGADQAKNGPISIVDLSLIPTEIVHIVIAVLSRMIFEGLQRYRRSSAESNPSELPTVLVLDEAHTFIHRDLLKEGANPAGNMCCRTFERIAREGRKFGLGLVLASQRPSEVSPTVLSQCNTFLLHRLVNDLDQQLVRGLVPDGLGDMLRELPSLPSRRGILMGWAAPAPILVEVRELEKSQRPWSPDPPYWAVWTGQESRQIDWPQVAEPWSGEALVPDDPVGPAPLPDPTNLSKSNLDAGNLAGSPITEDDIPF